MFGDELANEDDVVAGDHTVTVAQRSLHAPQSSRAENRRSAARRRREGDIQRRFPRLHESSRSRLLHDVLTGLPNRTLLIDRVEQAIARANRRVDKDRFSQSVTGRTRPQAGTHRFELVATKRSLK
jgi:hypothetical protein